MNAKVRFLIDEARKLTLDEQSELIAALVDDGDQDHAPATQISRAELRRRAEEVRSGRSHTIDADIAIRAVRATLRRK
jgi:putative addiction module component (TIGR02574 family)